MFPKQHKHFNYPETKLCFVLLTSSLIIHWIFSRLLWVSDSQLVDPPLFRRIMFQTSFVATLSRYSARSSYPQILFPCFQSFHHTFNSKTLIFNKSVVLIGLFLTTLRFSLTTFFFSLTFLTYLLHLLSVRDSKWLEIDNTSSNLWHGSYFIFPA